MDDVPRAHHGLNRCDYRWNITDTVSHCCALSPEHNGTRHVCLCHETHETLSACG